MSDEILNISLKSEPSAVEMRKYIRYAMNVLKWEPDHIREKVSHWDSQKVESVIKSVEKERNKPKPKRYYVSLKEPLEDTSLR